MMILEPALATAKLEGILEGAFEFYRNLNHQEREALQDGGREYLLQEHFPALASKLASWISNVEV